MRLGRLAILSLVHLVVDGYGTFIPALWVVIQDVFELSGLQVGLFLGLGMLPANVLQPFYGMVDQRFARWFVVLGPLLAVVCLSMVGLASSLTVLIMLVLLGMAGVGLFHPEGAVLAGRFGAAGSPRAMAMFIGSGFLGQALGPVFISTIVATESDFGASWKAVFPGLAVLAVLAVATVMGSRLGRIPDPPLPESRSSILLALAGRWRAVVCLISLNTVRFIGLMMIYLTIPLFAKFSGFSQVRIGQLMMVFNGAQGVGMLIGGLVAPVHRERAMLITSLAMVLLPASLLPVVEPSAVIWCLAVVGFCLGSTIPVAVQLGQEITPGGKRWISGMLMGFSWGVGALLAPPLAGYISEAYSPNHSFTIAVMILAGALLLAFVLPNQAHLNCLKDSQPDQTR